MRWNAVAIVLKAKQGVVGAGRAHRLVAGGGDEGVTQRVRAHWRELAAPLAQFGRDEAREFGDPHQTQLEAIGEAHLLFAGKPPHVSTD